MKKTHKNRETTYEKQDIFRAIDFNNETVKVVGKRNKERYIPLIKTVQNSLKNYLKFRDEIETDIPVSSTLNRTNSNIFGSIRVYFHYLRVRTFSRGDARRLRAESGAVSRRRIT